MGKPDKWHTINTKVRSPLHRLLRLRAAREDKKLQDVIREALEKHAAPEAGQEQ